MQDTNALGCNASDLLIYFVIDKYEEPPKFFDSLAKNQSSVLTGLLFGNDSNWYTATETNGRFYLSSLRNIDPELVLDHFGYDSPDESQKTTVAKFFTSKKIKR